MRLPRLLHHLPSVSHYYLSVSRVIMPRGQKSKLCAREKRRQAREDPKDMQGAQVTVAEEEESLTSSPHFKGSPGRSSAVETPSNEQEPEGALATTTAAAVSCTASNEGIDSQVEEKSNASQAEDTTEQWPGGPLDKKVAMLVHYLLYKYQIKEPVTKADMLKNAVQMQKSHFPEILRRASDHLELVFGLDMKEVDPNKGLYVLVTKLELGHDARVSLNRSLPKTGLLRTVLAVIFSQGNSAPEEEIWKMLNMMGVYDGEKHFIYGEPRNLLTKYLAEEQYLEYREVPNSDPPSYEFLWGTRAYAETSKMKVLKFLAKIHDTVPSAFPSHYEEALKDEEERSQARIAARAHTAARASARSKATSSYLACPKSQDHLLFWLLHLKTVTMPRGQKSKLRTREKRRQARGGLEDLLSALAILEEEEEHPPSSSVCFKDVSQRSLDGTSNHPHGAPSTSTSAMAVSRTRHTKGVNNQMEERPRCIQDPAATDNFPRGLLDEKVVMLVYYLLFKYQMKEPITKADMLRNVTRMSKSHFPIILSKASEHLELIFGPDLKKMEPNKHIYVLVNKLDLGCDVGLSDEPSVPKTGLLMTVLGIIFTKGNCATEEQVWNVLNMMGLHDGIEHVIFGDPRKLLTKDLVKENYLEYQQVPNSDPPCYQFPWGPKAHAETSKMKVLEFLAKINNAVPSDFSPWYTEALQDEEERARARVAAKAHITAVARARSKCSTPLSLKLILGVLIIYLLTTPQCLLDKEKKDPVAKTLKAGPKKGVCPPVQTGTDLLASFTVSFSGACTCSQRNRQPRLAYLFLDIEAKIDDSVPSAFPAWYEEALKDEEERAQVKAAARARIRAMANARSKAILKEEGNAQYIKTIAKGTEGFDQSEEESGQQTEESRPCSSMETTQSFQGVGISHKAFNEKAKRTPYSSSPDTQGGNLMGIPTLETMLSVQFLLRKYNTREPITKHDMVRYVIKKDKAHFHEILKKASELMVLAFGVDVKEVDPTRHYDVLSAN
ncbi:Melanoma-associated antigen B10 [Plecturocebus cupreus]